MSELLSISELESMASIFRGKRGNAFAQWLKDVLKVSRVEQINDSISQWKGADFAKATNEAAGVAYTVNGLPREEAIEHFKAVLPEGPFITISNHPIGSLDGTILIDFMGHVRNDFKVMVNEILARFESLRPSLIRVNPNGNDIAAPTAQSISGVREAMALIQDGHVLGLFPAGAVSDLKLGRRPEGESRVRDREWQMSVIRLIRKMKVPVLPVRFLDGNSRFYYSLGLIDWRVRLLRLPSEMLNKSGKTLRLAVGPLISAEKIAETANLQDLRNFLRASVYSLTDL